MLGSNMGDTFENLRQARKHIAADIGNITKTSHFYETEPWGLKDQSDFLNQAVRVLTTLSPNQVLFACKDIEAKMGRTVTRTWGERNIDIDLLFYESKVIREKNLVVPHLEIQDRNFVLIPMLELAPEYVHPVFDKTIEELYDESKDMLEVIMLDNEF